jgi:nucleotide-binding universal stress UspA family protein
MASTVAGASGNRIVVIAVDASDFAREAFNYYLNDIYRPDDFVVVCHSPELSDNLPSLSIKHGLSLPVEEWQKALKDQLDKTRKLEENYETDLISKKIKYKMHFEPSKSAGPAIISVAENQKANLIVVGTRGLSAVRRTVMGSVSDYVVHHSKVPVLVCPRSSSSSTSS